MRAASPVAASYFGRQPAPRAVGVVGQEVDLDKGGLVIQRTDPDSQGIFVRSLVMNEHNGCVSGSQASE